MYRDLSDLNSVILRLANPYGYRQRLDHGQGVVPIFLKRAITSCPLEVWGDGSVIRDFLHIYDVIEAVKLASLYEGSEYIFNIGSGNGLSLNELISIIQNIANKKLDVIYKESRSFDVPTNVLSIKKAEEYLNWSPTISALEGLTSFYNHLVAAQERSKSDM